MSRNLLGRYIWIIDTIKRRGRITRSELNDLWRQSRFCVNDEPLCRRTFYNYKNAIAELFDIDIECDPRTFEYYIAESDVHNDSVTDWLLNSSAVSEALASSRRISDLIMLENIPSAREYLPLVFETLKTKTRLKFDYQNFTRTLPTVGVELEPYCARIFKQRWYVIGRNVKENRLKTYALDRVSNAVDTGIAFVAPDDFDVDEYFRYSFGIVVNEADPVEVVLRTDHLNAKYLNALPLHKSQQSVVHDSYCLFRYRMRVTEDLVRELLSYGPRLVVEQPQSLRRRMQDEYRRAVEAYAASPRSTSTRTTTALPITDPEVLDSL